MFGCKTRSERLLFVAKKQTPNFSKNLKDNCWMPTFNLMSSLMFAHNWLLPKYVVGISFSVTSISTRTLAAIGRKMRIIFSMSVLVSLLCLSAEAFPQKKKDLDRKLFRKGKSDLLQGCTPLQLLDLDQENIACYKRVKINCFAVNKG